jgi:hypothetical protein
MQRQSAPGALPLTHAQNRTSILSTADMTHALQHPTNRNAEACEKLLLLLSDAAADLRAHDVSNGIDWRAIRIGPLFSERVRVKATTGDMRVSDDAGTICGTVKACTGLVIKRLPGGGPVLEAGTRCRLNELGRQRSPKLATKIGRILRRARNTRQYHVLWDGNVTPVTLHRTYIEPLSGEEQILRRLPGTPVRADLPNLSKAG